MKTSVLSVLGTIVSLVASAAAQPPAPVEPCIPAWDGFHGSDELPSSILSAARGPDGFIYLGGRDGLYRMEGGSVRAWHPNFSQPGALHAGRVQALASTDDILWIGTEAGLVTYNPTTDIFERPILGDGTQRPGSISSIEVIEQSVWIGTELGVARARLGHSTEETLSHLMLLPDSPESVIGFAWVGDTVVTASEDRLYTLNEDGSFDRMVLDVDEQDLRAMTVGPKGRLWLSTSDTLFHSSDATLAEWTTYDSSTLEGLPRDDFLGLSFDSFDRLWIASPSGPARWDLDDPHPMPCRSTTRASDRDQNNSVSVLTNDLGPYMFMGTVGRGASFATLTDRISRILPGDTFSEGLPDTVIWSTGIARDGTLYAGTAQGLFASAKGSLSSFSAIAQETLGELRVYSVLPELDGKVWVGTNRGLFRVQGESIQAIQLANDKEGDAVNPSVFALKRRGEHMLLGTGSGLIVLDRTETPRHFFRTNAEHHASHSEAKIIDVPGDRIWSVDVAGDRVFAAGNDIAIEVDIDSGSLIATSSDALNNGTLVAGRIFSIVMSDPDTVLLGTEAGLIEASADFSSFQYINELNGLRLRSVMSTGRSADGAIWIGAAGNGLFRRDMATREWSHITITDGLLTNGASQLGLSFGPSGEVVVSNGTGASVVHELPSKIDHGYDYTLYAEDRLRGQGIDHASRVIIGPDNRDLRLHFKVRDLLETSLYKITYSFGEHGHQATEQTIALGEDLLFNRLAPGTYRFTGELGSTSGRLSDPLTFSVVVAPFWWERQSVHLAASLAVLIGLVVLFAVRSRAVERRYELVADERKRIAQDLHDTFLQDVFGARMIGRTLVQEQESESAKSRAEKMMSLLETATVSVRTSVQALSQLTDVPPLSEAIRKCEIPERYTTDLTIAVNETGHAWPMGPQRRFFLVRIVQEAINNTCKHAQAQSVSISIHWSWKGLDLTVTDDGQGFDPKSDKARAGFGLGAMKRMAEASRTHFSLESSTDGGTVIGLNAPRFVF